MRSVKARFYDLTYWPPSRSKFNEQKTNVTPIAIKGFWIEKQEIVHVQAGDIDSKAHIYIDADNLPEIDGFIYNGVSEETNPLSVIGAEKIMGVRQLKNLKNTVEGYKIWV
jgi:hypothetical protein